MNGNTESEAPYVILLSSGFDRIEQGKSALMFASLAAAADMKTVLYCVQNAVDLMTRGAIEAQEKPIPGRPTMVQRFQEAIELGVEIQCCTQTMKNRGIKEEDLRDGVKAAGAMNLIHLTTKSRGTISF